MELQKHIDEKQELQLEIERMRESLSILKLMRSVKDDNFKKKINDTLKVLQQRDKEIEDVEALNRELVVQERKTNDKLQEAREELINVSILFHYISKHIYLIILPNLDSGFSTNMSKQKHYRMIRVYNMGN